MLSNKRQDLSQRTPECSQRRRKIYPEDARSGVEMERKKENTLLHQ
jgi:hypothetical protein